MIRSDLRQLVLYNTGRTDRTDQVNSLLDLGLIEIAKRHVFSDLKLETTTAITTSDNSISLPTAGYTLLEARVIDPTVADDGYPLEVLDKRDFLNFHPNLSNETDGEPVQGYVENATLHFGPPSIGDREIHLTMYNMPTGFASDATENPIRTSDTALVSWVTSMLFMSLEQFESASLWTQRFLSVDLPGLIDADRRKAAEQRVKHGFRELPMNTHVSHFRRMSAFYGGHGARW